LSSKVRGCRRSVTVDEGGMNASYNYQVAVTNK
jgi:hypothetical protein